MALHFVTASQNGVKHVQSYNDAHYNAGTLGNGCYILPVRDKLQASMPDSNTVRILGGDFVVCGRHIAIDGGYEEVNIDNGIPGYNRIDLVVARVETAPSEKAELKVYKGEETTGTPVVPGHVEGDLNDGDTVCEMPICSVRVNGINPQAPVMLAEESIDIMALKNRIESAPCVYRDLNASGSVNANTAKEFAVSPPSVAGYACVGIVSVTVNNPRCYLSKFTTSGITVLNANSSAVSPTVYYRLLYVKS